VRRLLIASLFALAVAPTASAARFSLVEARPAARPFLTLTGALELAPSIDLWRVPTAAVPQLRRAGLVRHAQPERRLKAAAVVHTVADPLVPQEWYLHDIGADQATAPGPGVPVSIVDTGIDTSHEEFVTRANVVLLNTQSISDSSEDFHGTAVSSVAGAPENGLGMTGVYPQAMLREYDADLGGDLTDASLIAGIEAALQAGPSVINLSVGSTDYDQALQDEIYSAVRRGSLVVAASGNSRDQGNPLNFPANMSHVLTVAATDQSDTSAFFSSSSAGVDLSAPGVGIIAAVPTLYDRTGYSLVDGTSFSAPMVAAAAAWVWTARTDLDNTQLFDLMRWSARDVESPGFDAQTGFGILDIPNALTMAAPAKDPQEPNDDIDLVKPGGLFPAGTAPLTTSMKKTTSLHARLDFTEDPEDVYRIWIPGGRSVSVDVRASKPLALQLWRPGTYTVEETGAAKTRDLAASVKRVATHQTLTVQNKTKKGAYYYADLYVQSGNPSYDLTIATPKPIKVAKR
jgi:hypothetical protein